MLTDVFYAFGDGRFAYDCIRCGAGCCRGGGFGVTPEQEEQLLRINPRMSRFRVPSTGSTGLSSYVNFATGCWFLKDGRCSVHVELDSQAQPASCRLFPFGLLRRWGDALVVLPQFDCPLVPLRRAECELSGHNHLDVEIRRVLDIARVPSLGRDDAAARDGLRIEGSIRALFERVPETHTGPLTSYWAEMAWLERGPPSPALREGFFALSEGVLETHRRFWEELLQCPRYPESSSSSAPVLASMVSGLRLTEGLDQRWTESYLYFCALEWLLDQAATPESTAEVIRFLRNHRGMVDMLALCSRRVIVDKERTQERLEQLSNHAAAFLQRVLDRTEDPAPLGLFLQDALASYSGFERWQVLRELGELVLDVLIFERPAFELHMSSGKEET